MTDERYMDLDKTGMGLTTEEQKEGWHWCYDWDLMLVGPGMQAMEFCLCERGKQRG